MGNYSPAHICQCLNRIAILRRNSPITISGDRRKNGKQFVDGVLSLARGLLEVGVGSGDVVAISAFNSDWYLEWLLAVAYVGGIVAPLNYRWSFEEARLAMVTTRPVMLVTDESCNHWYTKFRCNDIPSLRWHISLVSPPPDFLNTWNLLTIETLKRHSTVSLSSNYSWAPEDAVIICFTSGTTGKPKGVVIGHSALLVQSLAKIGVVGYGEDDVYLHTSPLCHIGGLSSALAVLMVGACNVLIPKFEAKLAIEAIEQNCVTSFITVPAIMAALVSSISLKENWKGRDNVMKILNGGGTPSVQLINECIKFFPRAKLISAYGMTETCSSLTFKTIYDPTLKTQSQSLHSLGKMNSNSVRQQGFCVGKPAPHVELKISEDGSGHVGRILTRGPHLMLRYWDQTPTMVSNSGIDVWLDTGDIGSIDDFGNVWLVGRTNGRIKSGGENVYPEEVETILLQHPGILATVIVGIPDARLTEMVVACIQVRENWQWSYGKTENSAGNKEMLLSSVVLQSHCREKNLTGFKIPKMFVLWGRHFPVTTTGKVRRDEVRREVISHLQSLTSKL